MYQRYAKDGKEFTIRRPVEADAEDLINYSKIVFASTDQVLTIPEEYTVTVPQEKIWINNINQNRDALLLVATLDSQVIGFLFFIPQTKNKNRHTGEFGISVHPDLQGLGIGRGLVEALLKWAKDNTVIEKVFLNVFATNQKAIQLYKDLGFIEEGRHIKAAKQLSGEYVDVLQMYIETK